MAIRGTVKIIRIETTGCVGNNPWSPVNPLFQGRTKRACLFNLGLKG
jgi:hypothetical protein